MNSLNDLAAEEAATLFRACCGSKVWATSMVRARPFHDPGHLERTAEMIWEDLQPADYLEAFAAHPRIGDKEALREKFSSDRWAEGEQSGASGASERLLDELATANLEYEKRFGYIFIICATGKSAEEMLDALRGRLANSPEDELRIASAEQARITHLRLQKLLAERGQ